MSIQQLRNVNFGASKLNATGSNGVGYQLLDFSGSVVLARTTTGVYQTAPGIYAAYITFSDEFRGQILWDTGSIFATASYATEQYNYEENSPKIDSIKTTVDQTYLLTDKIWQVDSGRWKIIGNQMIFYRDDNATELFRFNLYDNNGDPTMESVYDRIRI